jgi:patatin-like phospholipase/acyl hydrolase
VEELPLFTGVDERQFPFDVEVDDETLPDVVTGIIVAPAYFPP